MTAGLFRIFKLAGPNDADMSPSLNENGAFLANNVALLEQNEIGQWRPRPQERLEAILSAGYRFPVDLSRRMQSLETVAKALNDNNPCLAAIALVHAQFPPLPDNAAGRRMAEAEELAKGSLAYLTQPRVPAGAPGAGQWTSGAAEAISSAAFQSLNWLKTLSSKIAFPIAVATGVLFPDNETLESNGAVPDHHGLDYRFSEMRLTLIQNDANDGARLLFSGMPDQDGLYRDESGAIVGRAVGNSFMLDNAGVAAMNAAQSDSRTSSAAATDDPSDQPKLCPDPSPDVPGNKSGRSLAYQTQISGLPPGTAILYNSVMFDGCRTTDGTLLEAKGPGIAQHITDDGEWKSYIIDSGKADLDKQLIRQSIAAGGRMIEWHVAEPPLASYIRSFVRDNGLNNIAVFDTPLRTP
jgi:hypothetical protein